MKKTINRYEFIDSMQSYYDGNGFTYEGLSCLFDYLEEWEQATGEELELDVIALHCAFSEMTVNEFIKEYYRKDDIEAILSANNLESKEEITAEILEEYDCTNKNGCIVAIVNDNTVIVDTER